MEEQIKNLLNNKLNHLNQLYADAVKIGDLELINKLEIEIEEINSILRKFN